MEIHRDAALLARRRPRHAVVTLGVFDGVHLGHRHVLLEAQRLARERSGEAVIVTFAEHPKAVLEARRPKLITSLAHRLLLFRELGIDHVLVLDFDETLRNTTAMDFVKRIFVDAAGAEVVLLGHDGRFGRGGEGDRRLLEAAGLRWGFEARVAGEVRLSGGKISSTEIRRAILDGEIERAAAMLGRPVSVLGTVVRGDGRGRGLGFPTANLNLHHEVRPPRGVYGAEASFPGGRRLALVNIGLRPTFRTGPDLPDSAADAWAVRDEAEFVEVHLLDFQGDLYGEDLLVSFIRRLRGERRFASEAELIRQIAADRSAFLATVGGPPEGAGGPVPA